MNLHPRGRSNSVNLVPCSNSLPIGGFVRSRNRDPSPGGPSVSCGTERFDVCQLELICRIRNVIEDDFGWTRKRQVLLFGDERSPRSKKSTSDTGVKA